MRIAPGEPVPPGFENDDEITLVAELRAIIDKRIDVLIGLEYIVELVLGKGIGHSYYCVLCKQPSSSTTAAMLHITGFSHRANYLVTKHTFCHFYATVLLVLFFFGFYRNNTSQPLWIRSLHIWNDQIPSAICLHTLTNFVLPLKISMAA